MLCRGGSCSVALHEDGLCRLMDKIIIVGCSRSTSVCELYSIIPRNIIIGSIRWLISMTQVIAGVSNGVMIIGVVR